MDPFIEYSNVSLGLLVEVLIHAWDSNEIMFIPNEGADTF